MKFSNVRIGLALIIAVLVLGIVWISFSGNKNLGIAAGDAERIQFELRNAKDIHSYQNPRENGSQKREDRAGKIRNSKLTDKNTYHFYDPAKANAPMPYEMVNEQGMLTTRAAEEARLSSDERQAVQSEFNRFLINAENDTSRRAKLDPEKSDSTEGITVYNIPASPDRGKALLDELYSSISKSIGKERASVLCGKFDPNKFLGGVGRTDIQIQFHAPTSKFGDGREMVKYIITDPSSGAVTTTAVMDLDEFKKVFGATFIFE